MADAAQRPAIHPTEFSSQTPLASVVIACTYDPLGLQGPLNVWLGQLTGLRCTLDWVAYGTVLQHCRIQRVLGEPIALAPVLMCCYCGGKI